MPRKTLPPAQGRARGRNQGPGPAGPAPLAPQAAPRSFQPGLAKGGPAMAGRAPGFHPRGKSANRLIHAQKPRGR